MKSVVAAHPQESQLFLALTEMLRAKGLLFPDALVSCALDQSGSGYVVRTNTYARPALAWILSGMFHRPFPEHPGEWTLTEHEAWQVVTTAGFAATSDGWLMS